MKRICLMLLCACVLCSFALAEEGETVIVLSDNGITVNGADIAENPDAAVYLAHQIETHEDVPEELRGIENRVVTIAAGGVYRITGTAVDVQIAVKAGAEEDVRIILDGVNITCRTAPAIACYSARDPRVAGEYGVAIELAADSENTVTGSHTEAADGEDVEFDGAISSLVSLGFEGTGTLNVDADNEGVEVSSGHMTINGGVLRVQACDDPLNVSEDGVGTLTFNDGYLYSTVKPVEGGEGDGMDSNGYIIFNGGTAINLAHPTSMDSGIDSDLGSTINGGVVVGAGNMYDPIDADSQQLFMMLEFGQETDSLVVVTDEQDQPIFAYDFPYSYTYIAFSTPELTEGTYHVYLGGEIEGEQQDGLYTVIDAYTPGTPMKHGDGTAQQRTAEMPADGVQQPGGTPPEQPGREMAPDADVNMEEIIAYTEILNSLDLNELLAGKDLNELLAGKDLNALLTGFSVKDLLTEEQMAEYFSDVDWAAVEAFDGMAVRMPGGMGGPRSMESSSDVATTEFMLSGENTGFSNIIAAE